MDIANNQATGDKNKQYNQMDAPQGNDKAPNEETTTSKADEMKERQKGKKVDADPASPEEKP